MATRLDAGPLTLLVGVALLAGGAVIAVKSLRAFRSENADYHPRRAPLVRPAEGPLAGLRDVSFAIADGTRLRGWWHASDSGAAVVLCHGSGADRTQLLPEAGILAQHGYGVLLFDWPGNGESGGAVRFGDAEREALRAAVDVAARQPGVDAARIGVLGFSMGAAIVLQVAAVDPRPRAFVIENSYSDAAALFRYQYGPVMQWPARIPGLLAGTSGIDPIDAVRSPSAAGRPMLFISGSEDRVVPAWMTEQLYRAAQEPKEFWLVRGAAHGGYERAAPAEYAKRLRDFFDGALKRVGNSPT